MLHALFEDLGCAIESHEKIANEDTKLHSLDQRNYLFNGQEEGDYHLGQGMNDEASINDKELNGMMMVMEVTETNRKLKMIPQIH